MIKKRSRRRVKFIVKKYNKEQIKLGLDLLNDDKREMVELRYGLNGKKVTDVIDIAQKFNVTIDTIYKTCKDFELKLSLIEKYNSIDFTKIEKNNQFFKLFSDFSQEAVLDSLNLLNLETKQIIEFVYGLNNKPVLTIREIADKFNTSLDHIYQKRKTGEKNIKRILLGEVKREANNDIFEIFSKYNKIQVLSAIESLTGINKQIIKTKYLSDKIVSNKELAEQFDINENTVAQRLKNSKKLMIKFLNPKSIKKSPKKIKLFEEFNQYPKEQILECIKYLSTIKREVMELRYGLNGKEQTDVEIIAVQLNRSKNNIYKILSYAKKDMYILLKKPYCKNQLHEFYRCFPNYSIEEVNLALNLISNHHKAVLEKRYGLNGQQKKSISAIAEEYNISKTTVSVIINNSKKQITNKLKEVFDNRDNFFNNFPDYSIQKIEDYFKTLDLYDRRILELFYGIHNQPIMDIHDIAKLLLITDKEIVKIITNNKKKILKDLQKEEKQEKTNYLSNNENPELVNYIKQLIEQIKDPMEKTVLLLKLGIVRNTNYTEKEIAKILFISENEVKMILKSAMENLKDISILANQNIENRNKRLLLMK